MFWHIFGITKPNQKSELPGYVMQEGEELRSDKIWCLYNIKIIQIKTTLLIC